MDKHKFDPTKVIGEQMKEYDQNDEGMVERND